MNTDKQVKKDDWKFFEVSKIVNTDKIVGREEKECPPTAKGSSTIFTQ